MINKKLKFGTFLTAIILTSAALYANAKPTETPKQAEPAKTAASPAPIKEGKTHGDWKIVCERNESTKKDACYLQQVLTASNEEKKELPLAIYQFVYSENKSDLKLLEFLPQGILLQPGTSIIVGDKILANAKFSVCQNNVCIALADISKDEVKSILSLESVSVGMFNNELKQVNLPISTKGLKEGLEDLKKTKY